MKLPTRAELAEALKSVSVAEVAEAAGLSTKSIYRYRWQTSAPTMRKLEKLLPAIAAISAKQKKV